MTYIEITNILSAIFLFVGMAFIIISALGVVRMPDLYLRMSASTKSSTLGVGLVLIGAIIFFHEEIGVASRAGAIIIFLLITAPVAAHMIGRAAYHTGVPLWEKTLFDDLEGKFTAETGIVDGFSDEKPAQTAPNRQTATKDN